MKNELIHMDRITNVTWATSGVAHLTVLSAEEGVGWEGKLTRTMGGFVSFGGVDRYLVTGSSGWHANRRSGDPKWALNLWENNKFSVLLPSHDWVRLRRKLLAVLYSNLLKDDISRTSTYARSWYFTFCFYIIKDDLIQDLVYFGEIFRYSI